MASAYLCVFSLGIAGCGGEDAANAPTTSISSGQESAGKLSPQAAVVQKFLQAIQKGDRDSAQKLLTSKSIAMIKEHQLTFLPDAIVGGTFHIGKTVQSGKVYFVQCVYSVQESDGQTSSENLQWMVKEDDSARWAIFGMAIHMPNEKPQVVNFETDDMAPPDGEVAASQQASQPANSGTTPQQAASAQDPFQVTPR
jgi:hypothetical protein